MQLNSLDIVVIVIYMAAMSLIGLYFSRSQKSREDFFLGGRGMHWILVGGSLSLFSTISFMAIPGEMIRYGLGFFVVYPFVPLIVPIINRVVLPVLMRLKITSAYDYLEQRFDIRVSKMSEYVFAVKTLIWMGAIIYTASLAVAEVTGVNIFIIITIIGIVTTFYTSAGGLRSVIWTDFIQTALFTGCALIIPIYVAYAIGSGPLGWWEAFSQAGRTEIIHFSTDPTVRVTTVGKMASVMFYFICTSTSDQMIVQRYLSTPSVKEARRSVWVFMVSNLTSIFFLVVCGLALFAFYWHKTTLPMSEFQAEIGQMADRAMPLFIVQELPHGISGLIIAGLLAAAMSGLSSGMNSISSVLIKDLSTQFANVNLFQRPLVLERLLGVVISSFGIALAVAITFGMRETNWNLIELSGRLVNLFVGPLAVFVFAGILLKRANGISAIAGFMASVLVSIFIAFGKAIFGFEENISFTWIIPASFLVGFATAAMFSFVAGEKKAEQE
ncbi:MAG: sodium/solute symporter [Acidobacteria bacterium]|nr:sodium/solute symporter [Acidobacteriota bacterium]